jgi:hypothetical protein
MKSVTINRFDKSFGPVGSSAGFFLLIGGFALMYFSISSIFLVILGIFLVFTRTSTTIDYKNNRVRYSNNICGILKFGKWIEIQADMYMKISVNRHIFRSYSRSNRTLDIKTHMYQVMLYSNMKEKIIPLAYGSTKSEATRIAKDIADNLNLEIISY